MGDADVGAVGTGDEEEKEGAGGTGEREGLSGMKKEEKLVTRTAPPPHEVGGRQC